MPEHGLSEASLAPAVGQVPSHPVAFFDPRGAQCTGEAHPLAAQLPEGDLRPETGEGRFVGERFGRRSEELLRQIEQVRSFVSLTEQPGRILIVTRTGFKASRDGRLAFFHAGEEDGLRGREAMEDRVQLGLTQPIA